jgi:hypothetical protein
MPNMGPRLGSYSTMSSSETLCYDFLSPGLEELPKSPRLAKEALTPERLLLSHDAWRKWPLSSSLSYTDTDTSTLLACPQSPCLECASDSTLVFTPVSHHHHRCHRRSSDDQQNNHDDPQLVEWRNNVRDMTFSFLACPETKLTQNPGLCRRFVKAT